MSFGRFSFLNKFIKKTLKKKKSRTERAEEKGG